MLDQALGLLDDHVRDLNVALRRLVEGRGDDLAVHRTLHVGHFFRPLVDEQNDQLDLRMILRDAVCDLLEQHRFTGPRRRDDQCTLTLADRQHMSMTRAEICRPRSPSSICCCG